MASRRNVRRRSCDGKKRFASEQAALRAAHLTIERRTPGLRPLLPYRCGSCGWFHIGHRPALVVGLNAGRW